MSGNTITILICLVLAAFTAYREYRRYNKARLAWRVAAGLVAVIALSCIALPLKYTATITEGNIGKVLLTSGFNKDSLPKNDRVFTLERKIHQGYPKAKLLTNITDLFSDSVQNGPIHIYGYGLSESDLKRLGGKSVTFHPSPVPDGFTSISWTEKVKTGQPFTVQGNYQNTSGKTYQLVLKGLNTTLDSVNVSAKSTLAFTLTASPKLTGRMVFKLIALAGKDTLQQEQLPVIIEPIQPLKVLILSASPDFDTRFLKEWLGGNGYSVATRTIITKGKSEQDFINMDQVDLSRISASVLGKFDVLVGDLSVFKNLTPTENSALQNEVVQNGLGLIVRADSTNKNTLWLQAGFQIGHPAGKSITLTTLNIKGFGKTAPINIDADFVTPQNTTQALVTNTRGQMLSGLSINGAGKLAFTTIHNSYTWMLAGEQKSYQALWSLLIGKVARKPREMVQWSVNSSFPVIGQEVRLSAQSALPLSGVSFNKTLVYPVQNAAMPFQQNFTYWPSSVGWQQIIHSSDAPYWWYVWNRSDWQSLRAVRLIDLNNRFFNQSNSRAANQNQEKTEAYVPKIYFYILFLIAATFLWAESKFYS